MATALDRFFDDEEAEHVLVHRADRPALFAAKQDNDDDVMPSANATLACMFVAFGMGCDIPVWRALAVRTRRRGFWPPLRLERVHTLGFQLDLTWSDAFATVVIAGPNEDEVRAGLADWSTEVRPGTWVDGIWPDAANIPKWMEDKRPSLTLPCDGMFV